jgi:hypothetical protein
MSGFGALCPLPLRLGGRDATTSWTSADHAAAVRDLVLVARVTPFAHLVVTRTGSAVAVTRYRGVNGSGSTAAPTITLATDTLHAVYPMAWDDERGERREVSITQAVATPANATQGPVTTTINASSGRVRVSVAALVDGGAVQITVWGCYLDAAQIADYDGATDKTDSETEAEPYAATMLAMLRDARGSGFTRSRGGLVHVENLALARAHGATWRRAERLACAGNPALALETAEDWRKVLGVRRRDGDTDATLRTRNAAKLRAMLGATRQTVDDAVAELLGPLYVRTWRNYGSETIVDDNTGTFWPGINPGTPTSDLGGGAWYSDRQHIVVEVTRSARVSDAEFAAKMTDLVELLDLMLPATCTFDWCTGADDGFTLDEDLLDEGCLG